MNNLSDNVADKKFAEKMIKILIVGIFSIFLFLFFLLLINAGLYFPGLLILFIGCFSMIVAYVLVMKKRYTAVKFIVSIIPPYIIFISSLVTKSNDIFSNIYTYLTPRFLMLLYVMVPVILFGTINKKYLYVSVVFLSPMVFFFEIIHHFFGIHLNDLEYIYKFHPIFVIMSSLFLAFAYASILGFQKTNLIYRDKLKSQKLKILKEKEEILELNNKIKFQSNLYKILDIISRKKTFSTALQEVLDEILSIECLNIENKGLIFLTNVEGNLEISAKKNVEPLHKTCSVIKKGQCLCGEVLRTQEAIFCDSVGHNHTITPEGMKPHGHYVVPIKHRGVMLGVINIYIEKGEKKDGNVQMFLEAVASILSRKIIAEKIEKKLKEKNIELEATYNALDESISYAEFMQKSLIPNNATLDKFFNDCDVFYSAKDKVSGDFYFAHDMGSNLFFGVADCTGHGVPGSFLAAMSTEAVKSIIYANNTCKPNVILDKLRSIAKERFSINSGDMRSDSMDASVCRYNKKEEAICFSGGFLDLIIVRKGNELIEIKGTRCPVGSYPIEPEFEIHHVKLQKGDVIYLSTDGFVDQFGYIEGRKKPAKYKRKRFRELLLSINHFDCNTQVEILERTLKEWRGDIDQIDDVTVFIAKH